MCGLAGILMPENLSDDQLSTVRHLFVENVLANEKRGPRATGVVVCQENGEVFVVKKPLIASEFVKTSEFKEFMSVHVNHSTRILLGHTREPTKGTIKNPVNNHPIIVGDTIGVHNGEITNDDAVFIELAKNQEGDCRIGSVDSEAIFALFNEVSGGRSLTEYVAGISRRVGLLCGSFTTLFFNKKNPTRLFCLRYNNPISCHFDDTLQSLFFSSRYIFLRKTFGRAVISEAMAGQTGFVFDANIVRERKKQAVLSFPL